MPLLLSRRTQHRNRLDQFAHDLGNRPSLDLRFRTQDEAMPQDAQGDGLDVFVREIMPAIEDCPGAGGRRGPVLYNAGRVSEPDAPSGVPGGLAG